MPNLTPNYKFKKPIFDKETADIRVINENFDIADEELKKANDTIKNLGNDKQNKTDSNLLTIAKTIVGAINELFNGKLDKGGYTGTAQNLSTEISKIASKTVLGRIIVGKGLTVDSSGRTSVVSKNDGIIVNDNDIQLNVYDGVDSTSTTRAGSARAVKQANDNANGRVSKNGDEMTGALKVPAVKGLQLGSNYIWDGEEYSTILSNESGYSLLWRNSLKEGKSAEFIGITNDSKIIFRKDAGTGDKKWRDYEILHYGNFSPVNDLTNGGIKVPLSAEMGKKLDVDKQNKTDSNLLTIAKTIVGAINELFNNKLDKGGYTGTAQNLLTEISKIASKTVLGRIIVGKGLTVDSSGRTSVVSKNDAIIVNDNDIQLNVYDGVDSTSTTRAGSARAVKQANDNANGRVSKNGDEMTGALKVPAVKGLQLGSNYIWYGEEYSTILSNESGYSLFWRNSLKEGKSAEFIGITNDSKIVFRKDAGTGDKKWKEYEILHYGNFSPVNDLINGGIKVPLSAEMGKKLDVDKQNKTDNGLQTDSKEIVGAINESLWSLELKEVSGTADNPIILNDIVKEGLYRLSGTIIGLPDMNGVFSKALELIVVGYYPDSKAYKKQILFYHSDNKMWIRTNNTWANVDNWTEWAEILTSDNSKFKGSLGISTFNYIQDVCAKTRGDGYIDKTTGKLYMCKPADETVNSVDDTTVTSNFVLATILENTKRNTNITYGTCYAFHGGGVTSPGTGGDILNFSKKIKYASAIHKGGDPSVSIIIDSEKSNLDNGIIAFKSSTSSRTVINYTIVFE